MFTYRPYAVTNIFIRPPLGPHQTWIDGLGATASLPSSAGIGGNTAGQASSGTRQTNLVRTLGPRAVDEISGKDDLRRHHADGTPGDELIHRLELAEGFVMIRVR